MNGLETEEFLGRSALWTALSAAAPYNARLPNLDYEGLACRGSRKRRLALPLAARLTTPSRWSFQARRNVISCQIPIKSIKHFPPASAYLSRANGHTRLRSKKPCEFGKTKSLLRRALAGQKPPSQSQL